MSAPTGPPIDDRSLPLVDPDLRELLATYLPDGVDADNLARARADRAALAAALPPPTEDGVRLDRRTVPGPDGAPDVPVLVYLPPAPSDGTLTGALLHIHGGGYVLGLAESNDPDNRLLARELGCVVVSVNYRLAPETPHPGPVEDCYAALAWLAAHADELGVDPARIGVKGESAGGGLAAGVALLARDRGGPALALQHLVYPMIDDRTAVTDDPHPYAGEYVWTPASNRFGWTSLLGAEPGGPDVSPYAAAARATDLAGLPPTFFATGGLDLFLDEDLDYAHRLTRAGVPVELHVYPGAFHGFYAAPGSYVAQQANRDGLEALRRGLTTGDVAAAR